jgi:hypothetical protein
MKKKVIDLLKGTKDWALFIAFIVTVLGFVGNLAYGHIMKPKVKIQIEEEMAPLVERIKKIEKRQEYLIFIVEQTLDRERLGDLRKSYFMNKKVDD